MKTKSLNQPTKKEIAELLNKCWSAVRAGVTPFQQERLKDEITAMLDRLIGVPKFRK